jgi:hypothetical protein
MFIVCLSYFLLYNFLNIKAANPDLAFTGYWGSITFVVTGLLSFSASYTPTNAL